MVYRGSSGEYLELAKVHRANRHFLKQAQASELSIIWFKTDGNLLEIDGIEYVFNTNDLLCTTEFSQIEPKEIGELEVLRWNQAFYCVLIHDSEVSCRGILFYGASAMPSVHPKPSETKTLEAVWQVLQNELQEADRFQQEMLQMLLKRILILCTRFYKSQEGYQKQEHSIKIIRDYSFLVDQHFREKHSVKAYADLLNKSPKSLTNLFKKLGAKTPLQYIQERRLIEAHRLLLYTDKSISEIGFELGFSDIQAFSRFFKSQDQVSPLEYRQQHGKGNIANN